MSKSTAERIAPLTGVLFVVLAFLAFVVIGGQSPDSDATAQTVQNYYSNDYDNQIAAAFVLSFAAIAFVFFAASVSQSLREAGGTGRLAAVTLAAGAITTVSFVVVSTLHIAVTEAAHHASTLSAALALNVLEGNSYPLFLVGIGVFTFAAGLSAVRHGGLPKWLGWMGIVFGVVTVSPVGFLGFIACGVWVLMASIALALAPPTTPTGPERSLRDAEEARVTDESALPRSPSPVSSIK